MDEQKEKKTGIYETLSTRLFSLKDTAEFLTISPQLLAVLARKGEISSCFFGNHYVFSAADIKAFLEAHKTAAVKKTASPAVTAGASAAVPATGNTMPEHPAADHSAPAATSDTTAAPAVSAAEPAGTGDQTAVNTGAVVPTVEMLKAEMSQSPQPDHFAVESAIEPPRRKRGRPRKNKENTESQTPKRKRGRPRKDAQQQLESVPKNRFETNIFDIVENQQNHVQENYNNENINNPVEDKQNLSQINQSNENLNKTAEDKQDLTYKNKDKENLNETVEDKHEPAALPESGEKTDKTDSNEQELDSGF